jgi:hypothetical protein
MQNTLGVLSAINQLKFKPIVATYVARCKFQIAVSSEIDLPATTALVEATAGIICLITPENNMG